MTATESAPLQAAARLCGDEWYVPESDRSEVELTKPGPKLKRLTADGAKEGGA